MATLIKAATSGLIAASALMVIGTPASVALTSEQLVLDRVQTVETAQKFDKTLPVQKVVWSQEDRQKFWEEQEGHG